MKRYLTLINAATLTCLLTGCHHQNNEVSRPLYLFSTAPTQSMPVQQVRRVTPRYQIYLDLTMPGITLPNKQPASLLPDMGLQILQKIQAVQTDGQPYTIEIRAITNQGNDVKYVLNHTFNTPNTGPAQQQQFLNSVKPTLCNWIRDYNKQNAAGTDIYGGLAMLANIEEGLLPDQPVIGIYWSDLIHEQTHDPAGHSHFTHPTKLYCLLSGVPGKPDELQSARKRFADRVRNYGGVFQPATDVTALEQMLQQSVAGPI